MYCRTENLYHRIRNFSTLVISGDKIQSPSNVKKNNNTMGVWQLLFSAVVMTICPFGIEGQNKFADSVRQCYVSNPNNFNKCAMQFWTDIRPSLKQGIPELSVPQMDPMTIDNIDFSEQGPVMNLVAKFNNVKVVGVSEYTPKSITVDPVARTVKVAIAIPALYITGRYDIDGQVLLFPIKGNGPFTLNLTNIDGVGIIHMIPTAKGASASKMEIDFNIQDIKVELTGLSGGDSIAGAINKLLNDNSHQILADVKPQISQRLAAAMEKIVANSFVDMPREAFIA